MGTGVADGTRRKRRLDLRTGLPYFRVVSLTELKETIQKLSIEERAELNRLLYGWEDDEWDKQMVKDAAAGRLDDMIKRAETDMAQGRCREL